MDLCNQFSRITGQLSPAYFLYSSLADSSCAPQVTCRLSRARLLCGSVSLTSGGLSPGHVLMVHLLSRWPLLVFLLLFSNSLPSCPGPPNQNPAYPYFSSAIGCSQILLFNQAEKFNKQSLHNIIWCA